MRENLLYDAEKEPLSYKPLAIPAIPDIPELHRLLLPR